MRADGRPADTAALPGRLAGRARRVFRWLALLVAGLLSVSLALVGWLLLTESGLRAGLSLLAWSTNGQVSAGAPGGRLAGAFRIPALRIETDRLRLQIDVLDVDWRPAALLEPRIAIERVVLGEVALSVPASDPGPAAAPAVPALELPLPVLIRELVLGRFVLHPWQDDPQAPGEAVFAFDELAASIDGDRERIRLERLSAQLPFGRLALEGALGTGGTEAPVRLSGSLKGGFEDRDYDATFSLAGTAGASELTVTGSLDALTGEARAHLAPLQPVPLRWLQLKAGGLDPSQFDPRAPHAELEVSAELEVGSTTEWRFEGPFEVRNLRPGTLDRNELPVLELSGRLRGTPHAVGVRDLAVALQGGGALGGTLDWQRSTEAGALGRLQAALAWTGLRTQEIDARLPGLQVSGRIDAEGDGSGQRGRLALQAGKARIDAQVGITVAQADDPAPRFEARGAVVAFDPAAFIAAAPAADLNFDFDAEGLLGDLPTLTLGWRFGNSRLEGHSLGGRGRIGIEGERLAVADLVLELAGNRIEAKGGWGRVPDVLEVRVEAPALAALGHGLSGHAGLTARLGGSRTQPTGRFDLFADALELPGGIRVGALNAAGSLDAGLEGPIELALAVTGVGPADAEPQVDTATVVVSGRRSAHTIEIEASTPVEDHLSLVLEGALLEGSTGHGAGDGARWRGQLKALDVTGRIGAVLKAPAALSVARDRIVLDAIRLDAGERGQVELAETLWTPGRVISRGRFGGLLAEIGEPGRARRSGRGGGPLTIGGEWDFRLGQTVAGDLRIFRESGDLRLGADLTTRTGLEALELRLNAIDNRLALSWDVRGTELGSLTGALTAVAEPDPEGGWRLAPDAALLGSARFEMPSIGWLSRMVQDEIVLGGALAAEFTLSGTPADPLAAGRIRGSDLSIGWVEHGLRLEGGELLAEFDRDRLRLTTLRFESPNRVRPRDERLPVDTLVQTPGRLDASGEIALDSGLGAFQFTADRLPILQRSDRWLLVSGEGSASSTWTSLDLKAALRADAGYVELAQTPPPSLSDDVVIVGQEAKPVGGVKVTADVGVSLGDALYLSALGLDTRLTGELRLALRDGAPLSAVGTIATAGGTFRGYGQNLTIERGLINFQGIVDNPGLNVIALRKGLPVEAGIAVEGSVRRPVIRLVSEPNVPDPEKLSWIVLGRAPSAGSGADLGVLLPAAQALLGGSGAGGGMSEQLSRSLGFDEFGIGQGSDGTARAPTSRVVGGGSSADQGSVGAQVLTLGKRLSADLFLSFEQSLGGAQSLVKLSYQLSRRVSLVVRGGSENAADVFYTVSFR